MRGNIVGLLAAALMGVCGVASANIIYNVDVTDGLETATGPITTDGHSAADIVSGSLAGTGSVSITDIGPPAAPFCNALGCGLSVPGGPVFGGGRLIRESPPHFVSEASVPEPPTAILLGIGLACLGLACTRARGRQSAAV
jgi:hypothetical protein